MKRHRHLAVELLESRLVLNGSLSGQGPPDLDWQQVIVSLRDPAGPPQDVAAEVITRFGGQLGHVYEHALHGFSAQLPAAAVAALANNPRVRAIENDWQLQTAEQVVPTGVERIGCLQNSIANIGSGASVDVGIAIIDTGIASHPDLNVVGGARFYTVSLGPPKSRGSFQDGNYQDDNGHGTHVAGIAAARDDGVGIVGVAPGARLYAVKVLDASGSGQMSDIIKGIDWVTANAESIQVANMSLSGQGVDRILREAIQESVARGIVYVVAAGNSYRDILGADGAFGTSDDTIPAAYPEVATISAMADSDGRPGGLGGITSLGYADDTFADFSNFSNSGANDQAWYLQADPLTGLPNNPVSSVGLGIDLMLPGVDIYSTDRNGGYSTKSGTSMAAPHAAGLAALHIAEHGRANNAAQVYAIRQALIDGGVPWRSGNGLISPPVGQPNTDSPDKHEENLGWAGGQTQPSALAVTIVPLADDVLLGTVVFAAQVMYAGDDDVAVEFFVAGEKLENVFQNGDLWSVEWDTTTVDDGEYTLEVRATAGDRTATQRMSLSVDNIPAFPTVEIVAPADGAIVFDQLLVTAVATADWRYAVVTVEFTLGDETFLDTVAGDGWSVLWDTAELNDGDYVLVAKVTDSAGKTASDTILVTVNNEVRSVSLDLGGAATWINKNIWEARVTVTVLDQSGSPLAGASVAGIWDNGKLAAGLTDGNGQVTFVSDRLGKTIPGATWTSLRVTRDGYEYQHVPASITVHSNNTTTRSSAVAHQAAAWWDLWQNEERRKMQGRSDHGKLLAIGVDQWMAGL